MKKLKNGKFGVGDAEKLAEVKRAIIVLGSEAPDQDNGLPGRVDALP